jgi:[acyl-carrier-protein] S-malonyltransferase
MSLAFVFPGQASQFVGMGNDLFSDYSIAKEIYNQANEILEFDIKKISFEGPEEELKQTYITQPAIFIHSYIIYKLFHQKEILPDFVAGHSLGEYSALVAAGAFSFEIGLKLVKLRGRLMQDAGTVNPGTMAAIIGLSPEQIVDVCDKASEAGVVVPANFNSTGQIAISGSIAGVKKAMELAKEAGAKKTMELVVSGAFHSPLMESATTDMVDALNNTDIKQPNCPIVANVTGQPTTNPEEIRENLIKQLTNPVRWIESMQSIIDNKVTQFYEVGPGKVLSGLLKRIDRSVTCTPIGKTEDIEKI